MTKIFRNKILVLVPFLFVLVMPAFSQVPFSRGVNLTNWFQAGSEGEIQFTKFTKDDIINIKSLGCDIIRLPVY